MSQLPPHLLCVDFGSTFTKVALLDTDRAVLLGTAQHRTTIPDASGRGDVLDGLAACRAELAARHPEAAAAPVLACSSAGGGLRIAVVGNEELVSAEAGRRVALSSGGKVVAVLAGGLDTSRFAALREAEPDVILLVGGTDGGNAEQLLGDAAFLAQAAWAGPVVVAGDVDSQPAIADVFEKSGTPHVLADNVVPRIGILAPDAARAAIREMFLSHVIGGKHLSASDDFRQMVLGPTPDVVLLGVEELARAHGGSEPGSGVLVVDVGGATTDVHSVLVPDPEESELGREVVATSAITRTVEGDLGMRWSAASTAELLAESGLEPVPGVDLAAAAERRSADPGLLAAGADEVAVDRLLASIAVRVAVRRHAGRSRVVLGPDGRVVERSGKNVRAVDLLVGSGGILRAATDQDAALILGTATGIDRDGWQLPEAPALTVDHDSVLAVAGLLALHGERAGLVAEASDVARNLICTSVIGTASTSGRNRS